MPVPPPSRLQDPQGLNDLLLYRLGRLYATAGAMVVRLCEGQFGITRREWRIVAWLAETGPLQPSVLAERADLDRARTSRAISSLLTKGLVQRVVVVNDRRLATVALTALGQALHARLLPRVAEINRAILEPLADVEVAQLDRMLGQLQQRSARLLAEGEWPKAQRGRVRRTPVTR